MPIALEVLETGDRCTYRVRSEANPRNVYTVDILAHGGIGECTCPHWRTTVWPRIRDGKLTLAMPCEDKHIAAARGHFLRTVLAAMAEQEEPAHSR